MDDIKGTWEEVFQRNERRDAFLSQALEDIDGFDGVLLPQDFYNFIVGRDGSCPYTVEELAAWLSEDEESEEDEEVEGDGSGLHQCPYCYNLVSEEHEEFCRLNPNRNENFL